MPVGAKPIAQGFAAAALPFDGRQTGLSIERLIPNPRYFVGSLLTNDVWRLAAKRHLIHPSFAHVAV